jgi:hypothetical protein
MRNLFFVLLTVIGFSVSAQIKEVAPSKYVEIGKVGGGLTPFVSSLSVIRDTSTGGTNYYLWMYRNLKYSSITDIKSITFTASNEELEGLYNLLKTQMGADKGSEKRLELGKSTLNFTTTKNLGVASLIVYDLTASGGYFYLSNKQLDKLFGKQTE